MTIKNANPRDGMFCLKAPKSYFILYDTDMCSETDLFDVDADLDFALVKTVDVPKYEKIMKAYIEKEANNFNNDFAEFGFGVYCFGQQSVIVAFSASDDFVSPLSKLVGVEYENVPNADKENCKYYLPEEIYLLMTPFFEY